jgi:phosphate starvation-inducible PhoH-like protein
MGKATGRKNLRYSIKLNKEQVALTEEIRNNDITVVTGQAGSGKTLVAVMYALDNLFQKEFDRIIITRPTVSKEEIGFLPGDIKEKLDPWLQPIYHNMNMCVYDSVEKKKHLDRRLENGDIEIAPISFMRGRTFLRSVVIVDEAQNLTHEQMAMVVGRLGLHSKMIICGDSNQIDLSRKEHSGLGSFINICKGIDGFYVKELTKNHRHPIVSKILNKIETNKK